MSAQGLSGLNGLFRVRRHGSAMKGCMISALVVFMLLLMAGGVGTYLVITKGRTWAAAGSERLMIAAVDESSMPDSEKDEVKVILGQLRSDFENKVISTEDFFHIMEEFGDSPLLPATFATESFHNYYAQNEDLLDEDKASAELALARVARGMFEEKMSKGALVEVLDPICVKDSSDEAGFAVSTRGQSIELKFPTNCTVEELRQVIVNAEEAADEAGIPNELYTIDISDEFQRVIDLALGNDGDSTDELLATPELVAPTADEEAEESVSDDGP